MRAMILAAGLGTRLRPLTGEMPKPLLPVANRPLLRNHLELLKAAGVRQVMINLHHNAVAIPQALGDGSQLGLELFYSHEPEILGTGGGIKAVEGFLSAPGEPFFVLNGDLLMEVSLADVLEVHRTHGAMATMVLREDPRASQYGALGVDRADRILDFVGRARFPGTVVRQGLFTGVHVMEPGVLELIPPGFCGINETAYPQMVRDGLRVQACFQPSGYWSDVGTPKHYFDANMAMLERRISLPGPSPFDEAALAHDGETPTGSPDRVDIAPDVQLLPPYLIGAGARIDAGARIGPSVCIGANARIGAGAMVRRSVLWPETRLDPDSSTDGVIVWRQDGETRRLEGFDPNPGQS